MSLIIDPYRFGGADAFLAPHHLDVPPWAAWAASDGTPTRTVSSSSLSMGQARRSTVNNYVEWDFYVDAGTYTLTWIYNQNTNLGIATASIDGVDLSPTIDGYGASAPNTVAQWAGLVISAGDHTLRMRVDSKNASSSDWFQMNQWFTFTRTGA